MTIFQKIKKIGWLAVIWSIIAKLLSPILWLLEKACLSKKCKIKDWQQPIFIVGAPRSGSTILYQYLTHYLDFLYPDNLACHFHQHFFSGFWLSHLFYKNRPHHSFSSQHGRTYHEGMHAPGEAAGYWYRWFPRDRDFVEADELSSDTQQKLRQSIFQISAYCQKPIVFKNLNNGQRLRALQQIFPKARIILIKRNALDNATSILKARKKDGILAHHWWSVRPKNFEELLLKEEEEMVKSQIYLIEKEILESLLLFPKNQVLTVEYEDFCHHPQKLLEQVKSDLQQNKTSLKTTLAGIPRKNIFKKINND